MNPNTNAATFARGIRLFVIAALLAAMVTITAPPPVAQAFTFKVDTSADNPALTACTAAPNDCSLRGAITRANTNPGLDTITFASVTNGAPIVLTGPANENGNARGDLDILDGGDLTIQGNGAAKTIVDGGGIDRVFHVCPAGGCANTVIFEGVTIRNGRVATDIGGGILNGSGTTKVDGSTVSANTAIVGGGIYNQATLKVRNDSTVVSNQASEHGGGIYNWTGTTTVVGSTVISNTATEDGGGIYNNAGTTTVDGSTVISNTASTGGGIYNDGTLKVRNASTIGGAGRATRPYDGGGIFNDGDGTTTVDGSRVSANTADYGGGVYSQGVLHVRNGSTIGGAGAGNQAVHWAGGIYNAATTTVDGSFVSANTAKNGGGIYTKGTLTVINSTIGGAGAGNQTTEAGGGIYNWAGTATIDGSTVSANTAKNGGGIYNIEGTLDVTDSTIGGSGAANRATIYGGGICNKFFGTTTVDGSCILNNWATIDGGGLYNDQNTAGATEVTGSSIVGNSATSIFNNQAAEQTATGNWWGAPTGPNTPGADTVDGNVDTSGYLTQPTPGCVFNKVYLPLLHRHTP